VLWNFKAICDAIWGIHMAWIRGAMLSMLMAVEWQLSQPTATARFLPCLPDGTGSEQAIRIVVKYLNSHPEKLHKDAHILVVEALREAFPCSK
jgi:Rap1a immunity proteins